VIVVEPKYQINLGYIARTAQNFGIKKLYIVNPRASPRGKNAKMYAKHAYALLERAKICKNFDDATKDCDMLVATSGIWRRGRSNLNRVYFAEDAVERLKALGKNKVVGLLIGRDDTGLKNEEIDRCDMLAYISTDPEYPVLNISHALAVMLYLMRRSGLRDYHSELATKEETLDRHELKKLFEVFDELIAGRRIRNKKAVSGSFRRLIRMAQPNQQELHAIITALKK